MKTEIAAASRICILSRRNLFREVWRCVKYEFEDVVAGIDNVDMLVPAPRSFRKLRKGMAITMRILNIGMNPGLEKIRLKKDYELFVVICNSPRELIGLNTVKGWKERCKISVCWIEEIWPGELAEHAWMGYIRLMSKFDFVIISCKNSVAPIQEKIPGKCLYLLPGIDAIKFCPYPDPPDRCIDVLSLGRRSSVIHNDLIGKAEGGRFFYLYDTVTGMSHMQINSSEEHRSLVANMAMRSRYFIANYAKINRTSETKGRVEVGNRFFEGAASGTVMIGEPPETRVFKENFDWPGAVIKVPFDSPNISTVLSDLDAQPERLERIRRDNIVNSLLRHDWVYRWKTILDMVGLEAKPALYERMGRLEELAGMVEKPASPAQEYRYYVERLSA